MVTCLGDMFYPEVGERIVRLLQRPGRDGRVPGRPDVLRPAAVQLRLPRRGGRRRPRERSTLFAGAEHVVVPSGSCAWMVKHEYPGLMTDAAARAAAERPGRAHQRAVAVPRQGRWAGGSSGARSRARSRTTTPVTCCAACTSRRARGRCCASWPAPGSSSCRAPTSAAASAARSRCACPRCPRRSSTRSSPTSRRPAPACVVACDAGCLMQMRGGLSRRGSRVRALHLAEVLDPDRDVQ